MTWRLPTRSALTIDLRQSARTSMRTILKKLLHGVIVGFFCPPFFVGFITRPSGSQMPLIVLLCLKWTCFRLISLSEVFLLMEFTTSTNYSITTHSNHQVCKHYLCLIVEHLLNKLRIGNNTDTLIQLNSIAEKSLLDSVNDKVTELNKFRMDI